MARHKRAIRVLQHPGMDTYRGVALGVECAWPASYNDQRIQQEPKRRSWLTQLLGYLL